MLGKEEIVLKQQQRIFSGKIFFSEVQKGIRNAG